MKNIIGKLIDLNVHSVKIHYDGGGDSGAIEEIHYLDENEDELSTFVENVDGCRQKISVLSKEDEQILEEYAYTLLDTIEDWYNNDGGYGDIVINVKEFTYTIDNNIRRMEEDYYSHEGQVDIS